MAPIHDTDLAEERWSKAEWEHFELWEKIEQQMRRRRMKLNAAVALIFLLIAAIPPAIDRWPRWEALWLGGRLAKEVGSLKRLAAVEHQAFRIRFDADGKLTYAIERASSCSDPQGTVVTRGSLAASAARMERHRIVSPAAGVAEGIPGLVDAICYDPIRGAVAPNGEVGGLMGVAIAPVNDLAKGRKDRLSILLISGVNGELSIE